MRNFGYLGTAYNLKHHAILVPVPSCRSCYGRGVANLGMVTVPGTCGLAVLTRSFTLSLHGR